MILGIPHYVVMKESNSVEFWFLWRSNAKKTNFPRGGTMCTIWGKWPSPEVDPRLLLGKNILFSFQKVAFHLIIKVYHKTFFKNKAPLPNPLPLKTTTWSYGSLFGWDQIGMLGQSATFTMYKRWDLWFEWKPTLQVSVTIVTKSEARINVKQKQLAVCLGIT